jgi:tetratricopeptide (TPR) repeat protein
MRSSYRRTVLLAAASGLLAITGLAGGRLLAGEDGGVTGPSVETELAARDAGIAAWSNALRVDPESALALAQLAGLHLQRARETGDETDYSKAEDYARRSLALRITRNAKSYVTLANALVAQHRFIEAAEAADAAVRYDPAIPEYSSLLAEIRMELGDYAGARAIFGKLYPFQAIPSVGPRLARWEELNGNPEAARRILERVSKAVERRRDIPQEQRAWFHLRLGDLEMRRGRLHRAKRDLERGLAIQPDDHRILTSLARLELLKENPENAMAHAEKSLALRIDPATFGVLARAQLAIGDSVSAHESARAMEVAVSGQAGAYHREWSLFLLDQNLRVNEVHARAVEELETRKDIYGYDVVAWSLFRMGRFDEAARVMKQAMALGTRDPMLIQHANAIERSRK